MKSLTDSTDAIYTLRLLDGFGVAALMCDTSGVIQLMNNAAGALFGRDPGYFEGQSLRTFSGFEGLVTLLDAERPRITPLKCSILDHLFCLVRMQMVGRHICILTFEDVTDYKEQEDRQSAVLHMVAHDLNTPLAAITSYGDLLMAAGELNDKQSHFLDRIMTAVRSMGGTVRDLLDVAWIDNSGQTLETGPVSVGYLVRSAVEALENHAVKRNLTVDVNISSELPAIMADAQRLERVFINLIANAIKFTPIGGSIWVKVERRENEIAASVADNGKGIPPEHLPHIFDRFYRVPRDNDMTEGTGLGLSIVKAIVERHQGRVEVISEVDEGTTFTVYLPIG